MHAYASRDPVFVAMNRRGQRETKGALGDFCVKCHAPMAVREGATTDGLNLDEVPGALQGVTCYFCHNAVSVGEHFNNDIQLADDDVLRGSIAAPADSAAHRTAYSPHQDRNRAESSRLCGSCHDVVNQAGVHLERTFLEYQGSLYAETGAAFETCSGCHMPGRPGKAANLPDAPERTIHEHLWPGVDVALTTFPDREAQRLAIECALASSARVFDLRHDGFGGFTVQIETSAGHNQPSGAAQDRRMWLEVIAYDAQDRRVFESGDIADGELEEKPVSAPDFDASLALYRDWLFDSAGKPTHDFWAAAPSPVAPTGYASLTLPAAISAVTAHTLSAEYVIPRFREIARMTVRLRLRPIGMDVLNRLVETGDLDASHLAQMPTFTLHGAAVEWRPDGSMRSLYPDELSCPTVYQDLLAD
jgi:hypothetical protein